MASAKKKGERQEGGSGGRGGPATRGKQRSTKTVASVKKPVKRESTRSPRPTAAQKRRSAAAKKGAETKKREAAFRERVAHARAKEQRARALADKRRAAKALQAQVVEAKKDAKAAVKRAKKRAAEILASPKLTDREIYEAKVQVQKAEIESQISGIIARREAPIVEVRTGRELLEEQISKYYERAERDGLIKPLSDRHPSGKTWRHESRVRTGAVVDRKVGRFLRENTLESMVRRLTKAAVKAKSLQPNGLLYVSFSIVEYGRNVPKSPGPAFYQDAIGSFWQAYEGTADLSPASDIAGFEEQIRSILEMRLRSSGSGNAIMIDSFQVKSYYERTEQEQRVFATARRKAKALKSE